MGTSASFARKALSCLAAALLAFTLMPASAFAQEEATQPQDAIDSQAGEAQEASADQADEGSGSTSAASPVAGGTLASALVGTPTAFVNSDVALDSEPVVGSFTVDGMTFAVTEGSDVELVGVSSDRQQVAGSQEGDGSPVAPMLASGHDGLAGDSSALALPESITYEGINYAVTSIGAYAFYLSGVTGVELSATVADVDDRAFRSSDVASVEVADGNPTYSSFDGALYSADQSSLLLIPEGKQGTVLLPKRAEVADAGKFSHCSLASAIAVEEGSAAFASENGLLYTSDLTTLLRVPAGATDIVIRDGCTTIAAGALEACASLATITAPASVTSISPDVFTSVPTISLPAASAVADDPGASTGATVEPSEQAGSIPASGSTSTQLTAMVALSSTDDDLPEGDPSAIEVSVPEDGEDDVWVSAGFLAYAAGTTTPPEEVEYPAKVYFPIGAAIKWENELTYDSENGAVANGTTGIWAYYDISSPRPGTSLWDDKVGYYFDRQEVRPQYCRILAGKTGSISTTPTGAHVSKVADNWTALYFRTSHTVSLDTGSSVKVDYGLAMPAVSVPAKAGFAFLGYVDAGGTRYYDEEGSSAHAWETYGDGQLYAQWERVDYSLGFDVDSEPGDEDCPGIDKPDETVNVESGPTVIEDPKRPGYVFQGWVIPNAEGAEAIDQDLVYKDETGGKWYVDASKLPDYANDEGRVELTARWTSVISVDVPSAVTFYADVVTEGQESREGAASSAFGQNKVASQSEVDLRIVGLESTAVATEGTTLGADSILKKSNSATPSSSTQKLFSLYPTDKVLTPDDLHDPDAVSQAKPADAVDFALDDLLLEKSFAADSFTIPAGDTLNLGYRLNLAETGTELDYDKLATLDEGTAASIANISYCFSADLTPFWTYDDDGRKLDVDAIKADAEAIASGDLATIAKYTQWMNDDHRFYVRWFDQGVAESVNPIAATVYEVRIIGLNHDNKSDGSGKAGLTFEFVDLLAATRQFNPVRTNSGGWGSSPLRAYFTGALWSNEVPARLKAAIVPVTKAYYSGPAHPVSGIAAGSLQAVSDRLFLLSYSEHVNTVKSSWGRLASEGTQYAFYQGKVFDGQANGILVKACIGSTAPMGWWQRSVWPLQGNDCLAVESTGLPDAGPGTINYLGVCPAFCL